MLRSAEIFKKVFFFLLRCWLAFSLKLLMRDIRMEEIFLFFSFTRNTIWPKTIFALIIKAFSLSFFLSCCVGSCEKNAHDAFALVRK